MNKTILITGCSSGIGKSAAIYFSAKGWNVAATMRNPDKEQELREFKNVKLYTLDVTDNNTIKNTINKVIDDFGKIDVIVNNAGYGAIGIFEKSTAAQIQQQFETNVFGVMNVIKNILPHFRKNKNGTIINITSVGGRLTFPIYSVYHATKWAVEGFSESLHYELKPLGIKVKCVEPGPVKTDFYSRSQDLFKNGLLTEYDDYEQRCYQNTQQVGITARSPEAVAKVIYKAATAKNYKLRYVVGLQEKFVLCLRKILPLGWYFAMVRWVVEKRL
jgi:short-subunit dehydrogenase